MRQQLRGNGSGWQLVLVLALALLAGDARAQDVRTGAPEIVVENDKVQLDFNDVELSVVIDTIARLTGKNFIYDDRVRGRVTIVSPTKITVEEAYAVFESVLQVKGFTTVTGPGGAIKVIPIREAKESNIETLRGARRTPDSDRFITRLIPLQYIDAEAITNTLKPLVSKDASMVAYPPTNTVILTDAASNIGRILTILQSIDVETYKEELTVIKVRHADASTLADQLSEIFDADVAEAAAARRPRTRRTAAQPAAAEGVSKGRVRILTDDRTNSLIILAARQRMADLRRVIARLDVPVTGAGRIHVYYLKHADAEELATTLSSLISGQPSGGGVPHGAGAQPAARAMSAAVTELAEGITVTADAPTNALVIQATKEGFGTLSEVIAKLDIPRPQVLVEALLMEVDVTDGKDLGFTGLARIYRGNSSYAIGSLTDIGSEASVFQTDPEVTPDPGGGDPTISAGDLLGTLADSLLASLVAGASRDTRTFDAAGNVIGGSLIQGLIRASALVSSTNILSAPHVLTSDNEEAEIKVGANIPIVTSRVQSAAGIDTATGSLATSQNIERQDIGITLRVTPQISEGDTVRLDIYQEISAINETLSAETGDPQEVGVSLSKRQVENTVVVADNETVVIGGLISDRYGDTVNKVPWLGDIPGLGWLFKSTSKGLTKENLLIFLTPHIVRSAAELEQESIRKRAEFWDQSDQALELSESEKREHQKRREEAEAAGIELAPPDSKNPLRARLQGLAEKYPLERMREIEREQEEAAAARRSAEEEREEAGHFGVLAATFRDESAAAESLRQLIDAGYDGTLVSGEAAGTLLYEVRLGPYPSIEAAREAAGVIRESFGLSPTVIVEAKSE